MRKFLSVFAVAVFAICGAARAESVAYDTSDPLYMLERESIFSQTAVTYSDEILRLGQTFGYGINERLTLSGNIHYQADFGGDEDGFSSFDIGGLYRLANAGDNDARIITDVLAGLKFGGSSHVRTPWFADSTYYAGLRFGRQWAGMTLAATIRSSWIFDDERGMSYIDFMPDAYFRIARDWRLGAGFIWRKATNPDFDQEWINAKIVRQYGRTQYVGQIGYEFEGDHVQVGAHVNILF